MAEVKFFNFVRLYTTLQLVNDHGKAWAKRQFDDYWEGAKEKDIKEGLRILKSWEMQMKRKLRKKKK